MAKELTDTIVEDYDWENVLPPFIVPDNHYIRAGLAERLKTFTAPFTSPHVRYTLDDMESLQHFARKLQEDVCFLYELLGMDDE